MSKKSFVSGAIILMAAGFVVRILGFVYRIYLSNLIGAEGMGLFQLISPVYSLIILTLTAGISIGVSKMVAEQLALHNYINLRRITKCAMVLVLGSGLVISVFLYFNINFLVNYILKDSRTYYSLLLLIPCIPVIAAASALKGYFYGIQQVVPTAVSQIVEQIIKIGLVMLMAGYFVNAGLEYACALATLGMAAGEIGNLAVLSIVYNFKKKRKLKDVSKRGFIRKRRLLIELIKTAVPISANRFILSILSAIEYILIPSMLVLGGLDYHSSMKVFGKLSGMAMPLIYFPSLVTSSLATTLVPAISEAVSLKNYKSVNYRISKSIQITLVIGVIFTAIFMTFPNEIGDIIYKRDKIGSILYMLSFSCIFVYLQQTLMGVLNGLGKQGVLLRNTMIGSAIRIAFVYFLIPKYGIQSYVWGLIISFLITSCLNLLTVNRITGLLIDLRNWLFKPAAVGAVMIIIGRYIYSFFNILTENKSILILVTLVAHVLISMFLMMMIGILKKDEILKLIGYKKT